MFLQPHHFQAADRYWAELATTSEQWDHPYSYGLRKIEISGDALGNHQLQVNTCSARLRDGTLIELDPADRLERRDLKPAFAEHAVIRAYLAVPKLILGRPNLGAASGDASRRYVEVARPVQDENTGGGEQEVRLRDLNVRLLLETDDREGYEVLPIAQIRRAGEGEATPLLDDEYFPPLLAIGAWDPLALDIVRATYDLVGENIDILSARVANREVGFTSQEPGDVDDLVLLSELNQAYATLGILTFASGVHPLTAYLEMARLVGQLAVFRADRNRRVPEIPRYDHDDLARIFRYLREEIRASLETRREVPYEQEFFKVEGQRMVVSIKHKWLSPVWKWYVGVLRGELTEQQCRTALSRGALNWKLGSALKVDEIFTGGLVGLDLKSVDRPPRPLPPSGDWIYYQVSRGNAFWDDVLKTETLAMRFEERLVPDLESLQGGKRLRVRIGPKQFELQFALFAVQQK
jgi:type VI secretion system protein ImpJ